MNPIEEQKSSIALVRAVAALIPAYKQWSAANIPIDGLTPARMRLLLYLQEKGRQPMRALKEHLGTSATNITGLVDGLEKDGLVTRVAAPNDRRVTLIELTAEGLRRSRHDWELYESRCAATFEGLTPQTRARLTEAVYQVRQLLVEHLEKVGDEKIK